MALHTDTVLQRPFDCWCPGCMAALGSGEGMDSGGKDGTYIVPGCTDAEAVYEARSVGRSDQAGIANRKVAARQRSRGIMKTGLKPGDLIAVQNTGWEDQDDNYWIAEVVEAREFTGASGPSYDNPCIVKTASEIGQLHGIGCHPGEHIIAVRWYERDVARLSRLRCASGSDFSCSPR